MFTEEAVSQHYSLSSPEHFLPRSLILPEVSDLTCSSSGYSEILTETCSSLTAGRAMTDSEDCPLLGHSLPVPFWDMSSKAT